MSSFGPTDVLPSIDGMDDTTPITQGFLNGNDMSSRPRPATPENNHVDEASVTRAAAEVSVTQGANLKDRGSAEIRQFHPGVYAANAAIQGTSGEGEIAFEVVDEGGELVRVRFHEFLRNYCEVAVEDRNGSHDNSLRHTYYPYQEQVAHMARRQHRNGIELERTSQVEAHDEEEMSPFSCTLCVNFRHLRSYDPDLAEAVEGEYVRFESFLRRATKEFILTSHPELDRSDSLRCADGGNSGSLRNIVTSYFVAFYNASSLLPVRSLRTETIGRLTSISGTVTRTSDVRPELLIGSFRCRKCGLVAPNVTQQYHMTRPVLCRNPRCQNRNPSEFQLEISSGDGAFVNERSASEFADWQRLRVQENADEIPAGSMPRTIDAVVRNEMVERAKAGDRVVLTGSLVVVPDGSALSRAGEAVRASTSNSGNRAAREAAAGGGGGVRGLAALGVRELTYRTCFVACCVMALDAADRVRRSGEENEEKKGAMNESWLFSVGRTELDARGGDIPKTSRDVALEFSSEERQEIKRMKNCKHLYKLLAESIAPNTYGHLHVKQGILLMLLGGVHKTTSEGIRLRGDINVCIVGDPSTAKSQFLRFVHDFLPERCVYTSGKAASAAGLTAAVVRDQDTGEYCIEAGALMLADNGICCIDEFDKMDQHDQVAIHEAMEQQTISITKAGIQATLNARASILAAANPIHGRYDRSKTLRANVHLSAPILSRFDLFFVVLDECDDSTDYYVAKHIINVHRCDEAYVEPPFSQEQVLRYIQFARTLNPEITEESRSVLVDCYRKLRQGDTMGRSRTAYRITVRQLESLIRLSEALARLHCDDSVRPNYVREAYKLLKESIIHVETENVMFDDYEDADHEHSETQGDFLAGDGRQNCQRKTKLDASQHVHSSDYHDSKESGKSTSQKQKAKQKAKKKTQISFEQYESISNAIATHLRSRESDEERDHSNDETSSTSYLTWGQVINWYVDQCKTSMGNSMDEEQHLRKLTNLVIKRLIQVDHVLVFIGDSKNIPEAERKIAVHPNFVL